MKKIVLILIAFVVIAACKKKSTSDQHCWLCTTNDSVVSTIPALNNSHLWDSIGNDCDLSPAQEMFMLKQYPKVDTFYKRHDTLSVEYKTKSCTIND